MPVFRKPATSPGSRCARIQECCVILNKSPAIWRFPEMGVPLLTYLSSIYRWIFPHKPPSYGGTPMTLKKTSQSVDFRPKNNDGRFQPWLRMLNQVEHGHDQGDPTNQHVGRRQGLLIRGVVSMSVGFVAMTCRKNMENMSSLRRFTRNMQYMNGSKSL